jgi:hypothetical protein
VSDEEKFRFIFYRLAALSDVETIAREDGDPAELLGMIRDTLGICMPNSKETEDDNRDVGHAQPAAA